MPPVIPSIWFPPHATSAPDATGGERTDRRFFLLIAAGLVIAVIGNATMHSPAPEGGSHLTLLGDPHYRFWDFFQPRDFCAGRDPYLNHASNYLPLANVFFFLFSRLPRWLALGLFLALPIGVICLTCHRALRSLPAGRRRLLLTCILCAAPLPIAVTSGNLELWVGAGILLFLHDYDRNDRGWLSPGIIGLAAAAAMKAYPAIFGLMLLKDRRWRELAALIGWFMGFSLVSASLHHGGTVKALYDCFDSLSYAQDKFGGLLVFSHGNLSWFQALRLTLLISGIWEELWLEPELYFHISGLILAVALLVILRRPLHRWQSAFALASLCCFIPAISYDYKLLLLIGPLLLYVRDAADRTHTLAAELVILGLLFLPKAWPILALDVSLFSVIDPVLLMVLLVLVLFERIRQRLIAGALLVCGSLCLLAPALVLRHQIWMKVSPLPVVEKKTLLPVRFINYGQSVAFQLSPPLHFVYRLSPGAKSATMEFTVLPPFLSENDEPEGLRISLSARVSGPTTPPPGVSAVFHPAANPADRGMHTLTLKLPESGAEFLSVEATPVSPRPKKIWYDIPIHTRYMLLLQSVRTD